MGEKCKSAIDGTRGPCRDGFPQTAVCFGIHGVPICCNEDICAWIFQHSGGKPSDRMLTPNPHHRQQPQE